MSDMFNNNEEPTEVFETEEAPAINVIEVPTQEPIVEEPIAVEEPVHAPEPTHTEEPEMVQALAPVANGVMGVTTVAKNTKKPSAKASKDKEETVAVHSSRNVSWSGVGKVYRGINIVSKEASEKWITRDHCRLASPEEVAKEFGK